MADFRGSPETKPKGTAGRGRGRGSRIKVSPTHSGDASPSRRSSVSPPTEKMVNLTLDKMRVNTTSALEQGDDAGSTGSGNLAGRRGAVRGLKQQYERDPVTRTAEMGCKQGKVGTPMPLLANYFGLTKTCNWAMFQHRVDFNPVEDLIGVRKALLRAHREQIGAYMFDGQMLYCIRNLGTLSLTSVRKMDGANVEVAVRCVGKVEPEEDIYFQFYNLIVRKCLFGMELEQMGRNFFDRLAAINIPSHRLTLWPGYVTAMRAHEKEIMLCVEVTHKVLRLDSVLTVLNGMKNQRDIKKTLADDLVGTIVMTSYNRKTYKVEDIEWSITPSHTFDCKGTPVTYADYYQTRYQIALKDMTQPMLVAQPDKKDAHKGHMGPIYLVPELCQMTGLSDAMRANFSLMKDLSQHLHMVPAKRVTAVTNFMRRLQGSPELMKELELWGVQFNSQMTQCQGRLLPREGVVFAGPGKPEMANDKADWTMAFRSRKMLSTINLDRWVIFVPERDAGGVENLVRTMCNVAKPLNFMIRPPMEIIPVRSPQPAAYLSAVDAAIKKYPDLQMLFVVLPNNKLELYSSVKKRLSVDVGVPSQCFLAKNVTSKGLMSIATKVVIQMNAKLGGEPWSIQLPLKNLMFAGIDVYHGAKGTKGGSVSALVSTTSANFASYFNTTSIHSGRDELATNLSNDMQKAVQAYQRKNSGELPERIIIFRDGVGDGDLSFVYNVEMEQVKTGLGSFYSKEGKPMPKFTFIVVTKKINTRLFTAGPKPDNPPPGTVLDDVVTLPERFDFFLVAQAARQGTVSPCSYNVLSDSQDLDADKLQRITYKMCHMYFNWSGTVAVPAPCQYAHKLAALTGISLGAKPVNAKLQHLLHFL